MERGNFFDAATYGVLVGRIERLAADAEPAWGTMDVAQMLAHCAEVAEVAAGRKPLVGTPWLIRLMGGLIKRMVLSDRPFPRGGRTHPQYVMAEAADFDEQRRRLLTVLQVLADGGPEAAARVRHPLFGAMTAEEVGWMNYKHLDHHLTQFGV